MQNSFNLIKAGSLYLAILAFALQCTVPCPLSAQRILSDQEFWQPLALLPSRPSDITSAFASADSVLFVSNSAGLLRSSDNGATWQPSSLYSSSRFAVAASGRIVYAAPNLSLDGGATWSSLALTGVYATVSGASGGQFIIGSNAGVFRFSGNGSNLTTILASTAANCTALAISGSRVLIGARNGMIFYTGDAFAQQVSWGTATLPVQSINDMTFRTTSAGQIYICAATNQGVWYSSDFTTWQKSSLADEIYDMCVQGETFFAGTATNGVFRSTDNGVTWQQTSLRGIPINVLDSFKGRVFAGTFRNGIYYSDDNGASWQTASVPEAPINGTIARFGTSYFVVGSSYCYSSANSGKTWRRDTILATSATTALLPLSTSRLLLGTLSGGLQYSRNAGTTWLTAQGIGTSVRSIVTSDRLLLAACANDGVYRSNDSGETWKKLYSFVGATLPQLYIQGSSVFMINDYAPFLQATDKAIRSLDNGITWQEMNTGVNFLTNPLAFQGNTILGLASQGTMASRIFLRSDDGGTAWTTQLSNQQGLQNFITAGRWIYATSGVGTRNNEGIFATVDTGKTWTKITSSILPNFILDENDFLLTMLGNTVVRSRRNAITSVENNHSTYTIPQETFTFPNPTSDEAQVLFSLPSSSEVWLILYSALGREVWRTEKIILPAGEQRLMINVHTLPMGVYAYRLTADGVQSVGRVVVVR